jgi:putative transposase
MMHVHLVFVTKYRKAVFTKRVLADLEDLFSKICTDAEADLIEFNGEGDHVHLLVNYPPKLAISKLVNSLKGASSRVIRKKDYPEIKKCLWGDYLWSPSYFAGSCGGASIDVIKKYIEDQNTPKK